MYVSTSLSIFIYQLFIHISHADTMKTMKWAKDEKMRVIQRDADYRNWSKDQELEQTARGI